MDTNEEKMLVENAKEDLASFNRLYDEYYRKIFSYVLFRTGDVSDAEDITSEVFLKALDNIRRFKWRDISFSAWLYRIAGNEVVNKYRKDGHRKLMKQELAALSAPLFETPAAAIEEAEEQLHLHRDFSLVRRSLSRLPMEYQELISLRFFEKKSVEETARIMGKPEGTIKSRLHRGLLKLRRLMEENQPEKG